MLRKVAILFALLVLFLIFNATLNWPDEQLIARYYQASSFVLHLLGFVLIVLSAVNVCIDLFSKSLSDLRGSSWFGLLFLGFVLINPNGLVAMISLAVFFAFLIWRDQSPKAIEQ